MVIEATGKAYWDGMSEAEKKAVDKENESNKVKIVPFNEKKAGNYYFWCMPEYLEHTQYHETLEDNEILSNAEKAKGNKLFDLMR